VIVTAKIENIHDVLQSQTGQLPPEEIRTVTVDDALVDTGTTALCLPMKLIQQLGLRAVSRRQCGQLTGMSNGRNTPLFDSTIQGYDCTIDVYDVPDNCPVLVGQVPLEMMDWVVDLKNQKLIDNPAHGGEHMLETTNRL